jgi:hypothetical protein
MGWKDPDHFKLMVDSKTALQRSEELLGRMKEPAMQSFRCYSHDEEKLLALAARLLKTRHPVGK